MTLKSIDLTAIAANGRAVEEFGPLAAPGRWRILLPFGLPVTVALWAMVVDSTADRTVFIVVEILLVLTNAIAIGAPWSRLPRWAQPVLVLVSLVLTGVAMHADDGFKAELAPMLLVPLAWLAIFESQRWMWIGIALASAIMGGELAQQPAYSDVMRGVILLAVAVTVVPVIGKLVAVTRAALCAIEEMSELDTLTGLTNRRGLQRRIPEADPTEGLGLIFIDIDRFKDVNDSLGHGAGDDLLVQVGQRLAAACRVEDIIARIGGDEFVVATTANRARTDVLADRIRDVIKNDPFLLGSTLIGVSASVGCSHVTHTPHAVIDVDALFAKADHAMYRAKQATHSKR